MCTLFAAAEILRAQIWQELKSGSEVEGGVKATPDLFVRVFKEKMRVVKREVGAANLARRWFPEAIKLYRGLSFAVESRPFLTTPAYELIV